MNFIQFSKPEIKLTLNDMKELGRIINSGWFCKGEYIHELEEHFKSKFGVQNAVACSNCTQGLVIAFKSLKVKGKAILLPAFTWPSTLYALECNNNIPIWCDIDIDSWDLDRDLLDVTTSECPIWDAQISVDTFGNESWISAKDKFGYDIPTIYDAAHGYGLNNLGHRGDIEVVSMSFTKPATAMQGGMILFNDDDLYEDIQEYVDLTAKTTEVNAYVGLKSVKQFDSIMKVKAEIRQMYREFITVPFTEQKIDTDSNYSTFSILFNSEKKRNAVVRAFTNSNIGVKIYYEPLIKGLKNTDKVYRRIISLPTYEEMIPEVKRIAKLINDSGE